MTAHKKAAGESGSIVKTISVLIILANSPSTQQAIALLALMLFTLRGIML